MHKRSTQRPLEIPTAERQLLCHEQCATIIPSSDGHRDRAAAS